MTGRGRSAATWLVVPAYLVLTLLLTWPLAREFGRAIPAVFGALDPLLQSFLLGWDWQTLLADPGQLFHLPIFYPHPRALTFMDHLVGEAIVAWPIALLTGRTAPAYNSLVVLSFVLSGWFTYRLARGMGLSRAASFLGGLAFAFGPYRYANLGNLNQMQTQFLPLGIHLALRCHRRQRLTDLSGMFLVLVVQSWFGWYYFFHLALAAALVFLHESARGRCGWRAGQINRAFLMGVAAIALILPGYLPYWQQQQAMPAFRRTIGMTALWSADLTDYFKLNVESAWSHLWRGGSGAQGFWPGFLAVPLALLGCLALLRGTGASVHSSTVVTGDPLVAGRDSTGANSSWFSVRIARWLHGQARSLARRTGEAGALLLVGVAGWILSLGPILQVAGHRTIVPLPFAAGFFLVPGLSSMRAPSRFAVLVLLSASVLAAIGYDRLRRARWFTSRVGAVLLFLSALGIGIIGAWPVDLPMTIAPHRTDMPPVYAWLADQADRDPLVEIPMPQWVTDEDPTHARRQAWLLEHRHPRLDGVSGFVPPDYESLRLVMQGFPRPGTVAALERYGARWVIVHYGDYDSTGAAALEQAVAESNQLTPAARFGGDAIYRLVRAGSTGESQIRR